MNSREYSREFYERFEAKIAYFENIPERILRRKKRIIRAGQDLTRLLPSVQLLDGAVENSKLTEEFF